jgi:hypothetical protein
LALVLFASFVPFIHYFHVVECNVAPCSAMPSQGSLLTYFTDSRSVAPATISVGTLALGLLLSYLVACVLIFAAKLLAGRLTEPAWLAKTSAFLKMTYGRSLLALGIFVVFIPYLTFDPGTHCILLYCPSGGMTSSLLVYLLLRGTPYSGSITIVLIGLVISYLLSCSCTGLVRRLRSKGNVKRS